MDDYEYYELLNESRNIIDERTAALMKDAAERLQEKYHHSFEVISVGNRFNRDSADLYVNDTENPAVIFKAVYSDNDMIDDYIAAKLGLEFSEVLSKKCADVGLCLAANITFVGQSPSSETDSELTLQEYLSRYQIKSALIYLALDAFCITEDTADKLLDCLVETGTQYGIDLAVCGFILKDNFAVCADLMKCLPDISSAWFDDYPVSASFSFAVLNGQLNIDAARLRKIIYGED